MRCRDHNLKQKKNTKQAEGRKIAWIHNRCAIGATFGRFWGPFSTSKKKHCFENCFASFWKIVFPKFAFWDPKFENCFAKLFCKIVLNNFPKNMKNCFARLMFFRENLKNCFFTKNDHFKKTEKYFSPKQCLHLRGSYFPSQQWPGNYYPC